MESIDCKHWLNGNCELGDKCKYRHTKGKKGINKNKKQPEVTTNKENVVKNNKESTKNKEKPSKQEKETIKKDSKEIKNSSANKKEPAKKDNINGSFNKMVNNFLEEMKRIRLGIYFVESCLNKYEIEEDNEEIEEEILLVDRLFDEKIPKHQVIDEKGKFISVPLAKIKEYKIKNVLFSKMMTEEFKLISEDSYEEALFQTKKIGAIHYGRYLQFLNKEYDELITKFDEKLNKLFNVHSSYDEIKKKKIEEINRKRFEIIMDSQVFVENFNQERDKKISSLEDIIELKDDGRHRRS